MDRQSGGISLILVSIFECVVVGWCYGETCIYSILEQLYRNGNDAPPPHCGNDSLFRTNPFRFPNKPKLDDFSRDHFCGGDHFHGGSSFD